MNELSEAMGLASSTRTRMADQLVRNELVRRETDKEDRRVVRIGLSAQGKQVRRALEQELQEFFEQVLGAIQEEERTSVLPVLETITRSIENVRKVCCAG